VRTVAGLLIVNGLTQLAGSSAADVAQARRLGVGTAAVLATIDLVYVPTGRISPTYLLDAAVEVAWIVAWCRAEMPSPERRGTATEQGHHWATDDPWTECHGTSRPMAAEHRVLGQRAPERRRRRCQRAADHTAGRAVIR
jgi:hypothetical protein